MKTIQEQYNQIKKGKGSKQIFLTEAKKLFPSMLTNPMGFDEASKILKTRGVISENYIDLQPITTMEATPKTSYEIKFAEFLAEEAKVVEKKTTKEVDEVNAHGFDAKDKKNLDNQIGQEVLNGIYFEAKQNPDKTLDEIREIVSKNLEKDGQYYMKNAAFGVEGLGYQEAELEEVSGKYAASGYSDKLKKVVKESLMGGHNFIVKEEDDKEESPKPKKARKPKKESLDNDLAEIDKQSQVVALEAKLAKVDEVIEGKLSRINMVSEDENLSELVDKNKMKAMQKEVKILEKRKAKMEKMYEKMCGKQYQKEEIVDEVETINEMAAGGLEEKSAGKKLFAAFKKDGLKPNYIADVRKVSSDGEAKDMVHIEPGEGSVEVSSSSNQDKIAQAIKSAGFNISKKEDNVGNYKLSVFTIDIK